MRLTTLRNIPATYSGPWSERFVTGTDTNGVCLVELWAFGRVWTWLIG